MKLCSSMPVIFLVVMLPVMVPASDFEYFKAPDGETTFAICQTTRQKALKQRGVKVTRDKDDLIRRTVRAHGGDYVRNGDLAVLTLNGKTYSDFSLEIVDGKYLIIITPGDSFTLKLIEKQTN